VRNVRLMSGQSLVVSARVERSVGAFSKRAATRFGKGEVSGR
jgi:hypothetical protein